MFLLSTVKNMWQDCSDCFKASAGMQMSVFNCCCSSFLIHESEREMHLNMCIQIKYSRLLMKYSVSLGFLWLREWSWFEEERKATLMSIWADSFSPLNSACLFSGCYSLSAVVCCWRKTRFFFHDIEALCAPLYFDITEFLFSCVDQYF